MHISTLTRAVSIAFIAAMLVLTSGLAGAKLPAPTEEQKAQADLAKAKTAWGDKVVMSQTYKAQGRAVASYQAGGEAAHTQPGALRVDPGLFVMPTPVASAPAPVVKG